MDRPILKIFNFNGSRISSLQRVRAMKAVFEALDSDIISIQEIDIKSSVMVFSNSYHVLVNLENEAQDSIGVVTLVKRTLRIKDFIIGGSGRVDFILEISSIGMYILSLEQTTRSGVRNSFGKHFLITSRYGRIGLNTH